MKEQARYAAIVLTAALLSGCAAVEPGGPTPEGPSRLQLTGDFAPAHDPVMMRGDGSFYIYSTGLGGRMPLMARRSSDLLDWEPLPSPITAIPAWAREKVPGATGFWAPDIAKVNARYRLYYSVSTFGSRNSAIGLATSASLDPASPDYGWRDEGMVVASSEAVDYNAIDPNFIIDADGRHWLSFGSFWGGLKIVELDPATGKPLPDAELVPIARRDAEHGWSIEAPFIIGHGGWYYLIVSFDHCCRGAKSTYKLAMGRSRKITGPYVDRDGRAMMDAGGTILLAAKPGDRFQGTGHAGHYRTGDGRDILVYHAYDTENKGRATLRIAQLDWDRDGWPQVSPLREAP